jgi:conflict system STAND superfamily ATPase/WD40 domain-containing protein
MNGTSTESPYKGLASFTVDDADYFFGRDLERNLLDAQIRGNRLTVLYGASGAGKSSLLQAGLMSQLRRIAAENRSRNRPPRVAAAMINSWTPDPRADILAAAVTALQEANDSPINPPPAPAILPEALQVLTQHFGGTLILLLDQFEDFLAECWRSGSAGPFGGELAALVDTPGLRVCVLICVQEESLARLDILASHIPTWLARSMRLEHLRSASARDAIVRPIEAWNASHGLQGEHAYRVEEALVDALLQYSSRDSDTTATAYLQLILKRLWDEELLRGSRELRNITLKELGGPDAIVAGHLDSALSSFSPEERQIVAGVLRSLVTSDGQRKSLTADELTAAPGAEPETVTKTIQRLDDLGARILRSLTDQVGVTRYEIFHQVLVAPVRSWLAAADQRRIEREKTRARLLRRWTAVAAVLVTVAVATAIYLQQRFTRDERKKQDARIKALIGQAEAVRSRQFDLALLLVLYAREYLGARDADQFLAESLASPAATSRFVGWSNTAVLKVVTRPGDRKILAVDKAGAFWSWPFTGRAQTGEPLRLDWGAVTEAAFSRDGTTVATSAPDQTSRLRSTVDGLFPIYSFSTPSASSIALSMDGGEIAVGDTKGNVRLYGRPAEILKDVATGVGSPIEALDISPAGNLIAAGASDGRVHVAAISQGPMVSTTLTESKAAIHDVVFSPDGRFLAAGSEDGKVHLWSAAGARWIHDTLPAGKSAILSVAFDRSSALIAAGDTDGIIRIWSAFTGDAASEPLQGHASPVRSLAFLSRKSLISAQDDGSIRVWDVATRQRLPADFSRVRDVACTVANRNLTPDEWTRYIGNDLPYRRVCP